MNLGIATINKKPAERISLNNVCLDIKMTTESKIKESQMESPMKNMPCHEDPKQRNVGPTSRVAF